MRSFSFPSRLFQYLLAFGLGSGLVPKAPGTAGSLVALVLFFPLHALGTLAYLGIVALALTAGVFICDHVARGFCLFRLFDIAKPWPVGWLDKHLEGGLGIMMDDVAAGIYALVVLQAAAYAAHRWPG